MADQSSENAYQAALVTRDRALAARQDAIDVLTRLLSQMEDDPLIVKTRENLSKILENPEVITDEVFNNIMSKTAEVMDANMDSQVQQFLGNARAKGISGPALQLQLQRAKEARALSIASAYRDAVIERAQSGMETNLAAINATSTMLNQVFQQQRILSEDLANAMNTIVEEPFRNAGPSALPQEGQVPGGGSRPINADYSTMGGELGQGPSIQEMENQRLAEANGYASYAEMQAADNARNASAQGVEGELARQLAALSPERTLAGARAGQEVIKTQQGGPAAPGDTTVPVESFLRRGQGTGADSLASPVNFGANLVSNMLEKAPGVSAPNNAISTALQGALSGFSSIGENIAQQFAAPKAPAGAQSTGVKGFTFVPAGNLQAEGDKSTRGVEGTTVYGPNLPASGITQGGGAPEATRAAGLANTGYDVIGTSEGAGVRKGIDNKPITTTKVTKTADGNYLATYSDGRQILRNAGGAVISGANAVGAAASKINPVDAIKSAATSGLTGLGNLLAKKFLG